MARFTDPVLPIDYQAEETRAGQHAERARILRWICGEPLGDGEGEVTRYDIERMGFTIVKKEPE